MVEALAGGVVVDGAADVGAEVGCQRRAQAGGEDEAPRAVPEVAAEGVAADTVTSRLGERGTQEFAGFFVLPPGQQQQVTFTYRLPAGLTAENYRLVVQRQSGTQPLPLRLQIGDGAQETQLSEGRLDWSAALAAGSTP